MDPERKLSWKWIAIGLIAATILFLAITQTTARRDAFRNGKASERALIESSR